MSTRKLKVCKHAGEESDPAARKRHEGRGATYPGPRCFTCHQKKRRADKIRARQLHLARTFGLTPEDIDLIRGTMPLNSRGVPVCPGCEFATGASKALAADHDHGLERLGLNPRETVRGFLCFSCNQNLEKYGVVGFLRLLVYLLDPPAPRALGLGAIRERRPGETELLHSLREALTMYS